MHPSIYPVETELFPGTDPNAEATLLVGIAGGLGHDIDEFRKMYPSHPGVCAPPLFSHTFDELRVFVNPNYCSKWFCRIFL
jgi:hypothetical protein